jgi:NHLM bacteriocin system ABC transporter peptidase/ATP-binding protein
MTKKNVKTPLKKGIAKVPIIMQLEALECGAASLCMVMAYYKKWIPIEVVRTDCGVSRDGANALAIVNAAKSYGFSVHAYSWETENLMESGQFPCIIHWNFHHFVVLNGFKGKYAYINDPARGLVKVTMEEFDNSFTGVVILIEPGENFIPEGKQKSILEFALLRLKGSSAAILLVAFVTILASLFGILNPVFSRVFIDNLLTRDYHQWLMPFILVMTVVAIMQIIVELVRVLFGLKINGKLAIIGSSTYMWKIFHIPVEFFEQRSAGDIQVRRESNESIAKALVDICGPFFINVLLLVVYLVLMLKHSILLTAVGITSLALSMMVARKVSKERVNITRVMQRDTAKLISATASGIDMIETIKSSGAEKGFFRKWASYQASYDAQLMKSIKVNNYIGMIPSFISTLANYTVLILGIWLVMNKQFTLGAMQMFQGLLQSFMNPASTLIQSGQSLQEMRTEMERIEDVMKYPDDENVKNEEVDITGANKLKGNLEVRDVTFGYSRLGKPILKNFFMKVNAGGSVAIVGMSGSGKSTIARLIAGLYNPWEGDILFDEKKRSEYPREVMSGSIGVVSQEITLFEGTINQNIKMWDDSIEDFEVIMAARDSMIHDDILERGHGYDEKIISGGRDLSGGQCQRLEIARVLAQTPSIIILDEATSALDAKTENEVMKAIRNRGITCIVIAHRLSTIRDCEEIIVLDKGEIVEKGSHDELIRLGGKYLELVTSE